ncbi:siphovirus Gp157 family protein [Paucilactobacillus sp. N302-9]
MANDTIFDLTNQYVHVKAALLNYDDEKMVQDTMESVVGPLKDKITGYGMVMTEVENQINDADMLIKRIQDKKKRWQRNLNNMKNNVMDSMEAADLNKVEDVHVTVKITRNKKTVIDDETKLPAKYVKIKQTYTPDKNMIKQDISAGKDINGAHIEQTATLSIK